MQVTPQAEKFLHQKLPIDNDEKILAIYKHHWFAYVSLWFIGLGIAVVVMGLAIALTSFGDPGGSVVQYRSAILAGAAVFSALVILGTIMPVHLRSQEEVVLTEEALLQVLQPTLFASKVDQLSLQHITDVSVRQDFFGTIFGYGHITVETPGEQDNYEFFTLPNPHQSAREIIQAHENFDAALQGGRMPSTLGGSPGAPTAPPAIDPQQYQQFLAYQQMVAQQQRDQQASGQSQPGQTDDPTGGPQAPQDTTTQNQ